jgi:hypothetical protein
MGLFFDFFSGGFEPALRALNAAVLVFTVARARVRRPRTSL